MPVAGLTSGEATCRDELFLASSRRRPSGDSSFGYRSVGPNCLMSWVVPSVRLLKQLG